MALLSEDDRQRARVHPCLLEVQPCSAAGPAISPSEGFSLHFQERDYITEETIPMKQTWHGHSAFCIEAGEAKILIDPFLSDNLSRDNGRSG